MSTRTHHKRGTFVDPRTFVFWISIALVVYGVVHIAPVVMRAVTREPAVVALSAALWSIYGVVLAIIIYRLELFERRSAITMIGAFVWGAVVVSGIGAIAAGEMHDLFGKLLGPDQQDWVAAFAAPLVEEPLKMLGIIALAFIPSARINTALDGLFFGLLVGLGFEVTESFLYGSSAGISGGSPMLDVVLSFVLRGIVGGLWNHPTYTALTGAGVGYFFGNRGKVPAGKRWVVVLGSLLAAMVLHGLFDSPLFEFGNPFVSSIVKGLPALVLLLAVLRVARRRERAVFESVGQGQVPSDLVSDDELETLLDKHARKKARKPVRKEHGLAASHAMKRLQRSQVELIAAVGDEGPESQLAQELADDVREDRRVLAEASS